MKVQTISDEIFFPHTNAYTLFEMYTNADKHSEITESKAMISDIPGDSFSAYDGYCFGKNLVIDTNKRIVQTWRTTDWPQEAKDSILTLRFIEKEAGTTVSLKQEDVPVTMAESILQGWKDYYWCLWVEHLCVNYAWCLD